MPSTMPLAFSLIMLTLLVHLLDCLSAAPVMVVSCLPGQATALLRLRRSFTVTNGSACTLASWRASTDCCQWEGIRCQDANGRVTSLHLGECGFESAALDPSLFDLTSLRHLNLACNHFNGSKLPAIGFERLTELTHLNLSSSGFAGRIPVGIGRLANLVSLDLSTTSYLQDSLYRLCGRWSNPSWWLVEPNIGSLVTNLSNLRVLNLGRVDLSGNGAEWCDAFANSSTPQLQVLNLRHCNLFGPICASLSSIHSLTEVNLQYNGLFGPIPKFFADLPSLSVLRLTDNNLEGLFPARIFHNRNLTTVDIRYNFKVSGSLPDFSSDSSLTNLLVSSTNFSGPIPISIGNLKSLSRLGVAATDFAHELPSSIGELTSLISLEVSGAGLVGEVPSWIANLTSLVCLEFSNCGLSGQVPSSISHLKNLTWLALHNCNFSGPVPPHLLNLTQLDTLYLHSNNFIGTLELSSFWKLPHLTSLSLSHNKLSVVDGEDISSWLPVKYMDNLRLASCNISKFPSVLRNMHQISYLDLSENQIHGAIPHWTWENWKVVAYLNLSHNKLNSIGYDFVLPNDIALLDISSNLLEGPMPIPGPDTELFDCSNNQFSSIPFNFGSRLSSISYLKAFRNNLSGEIPKSICEARGLLFLDLSYNNLSGSIPSCLMEDINSLSVLNLKANQLQGELPHNIKQGCGFDGVDLSDNRIEGQLPRSLAACRSLQVLDVGNNQISDTFPCWMSMLPELQVLVLKSNHFFGKLGPTAVGKKENHCEFMKLRILSLASNNFSGALPNMWFKSLGSMTAKSADDTLSMQNHYSLLGQTYEFTTAITYKGSAVTFSKILKTLVVIDVSDNAFNGVIPKSIRELVLLCGLNMSNNGLTGPIPSQLGALHQLESLDLSSNDLSGEIPQELAWLDFLSMLNLSYNQLAGRIPGSPHFQTFSNVSFLGNVGLCGLPLSKECENTMKNVESHPSEKKQVDIILFLFVGLGYGVGFALSIVMTWGIYTTRKPCQDDTFS